MPIRKQSCRDHRAVGQHDADPRAVAHQRKQPIGGAEPAVEQVQFMLVQFAGSRRGAGRQAFDAELRKGVVDVSRQPLPFRRCGGAEKLDRAGELGMSAVAKRLRLVRS